MYKNEMKILSLQDLLEAAQAQGGLYHLARHRVAQLALPRLRVRPRVAHVAEQLRTDTATLHIQTLKKIRRYSSALNSRKSHT